MPRNGVILTLFRGIVFLPRHTVSGIMYRAVTAGCKACTADTVYCAGQQAAAAYRGGHPQGGSVWRRTRRENGKRKTENKKRGRKSLFS